MRAWLKEIRTDLGKTQKQIAKASRLSLTYYSYIESGKRGNNLPVKTAKAIASALNFNWQRFYE